MRRANSSRIPAAAFSMADNNEMASAACATVNVSGSNVLATVEQLRLDRSKDPEHVFETSCERASATSLFSCFSMISQDRTQEWSQGARSRLQRS